MKSLGAHIGYYSYQQRGSSAEAVPANTAMLVNLETGLVRVWIEES